MKQGKVGIVTVTFNSGKVLDDFFASVSSLSYENYTLYVIDNNSHDSTVEMTHSYMEKNNRVVLIINKDNLGVARGNNQGIIESLNNGCEYVLLLNNDTVFEPHLIGSMLDEMKKNDALMAVPKLLFHDNPTKIWCAGGKLKLWKGYVGFHYGFDQNDSEVWSHNKRISYAPTCCMLVHRSVFQEIGMMDEDYFVYCDDTDFCIRAHNAKIQLWYLPVVNLWHKVSSLTGKNSPFSIRMSTRNRVYMIRKFTKFYMRPYHYCIVQLDFMARILLRGERSTEYILRQRSFVEGLRMPIK